MTRFLRKGISLSVAVGLFIFGAGRATAQGARDAQHKDMKLVGFNNLQNRSTYQPTLHKQAVDGQVRYIIPVSDGTGGGSPATGM